MQPTTTCKEERCRRVISLLAVTSRALRYHTADTMSHGAAALLVTLAFYATLRSSRDGSKHAAFTTCTGLALGLLFATRPVSSVAPVIVCAMVLFRRKE